MIRENKYLVLKNADIEKHLSDEHQLKLDLFTTKIRIGRLNDGKQDQQYVVVAADWPMYETVWQMVEAFVDGKPNELEISQAENAALKERVVTLEKLQGVALIESLRAEVERLRMALADTEALELGTAERCKRLQESYKMQEQQLAASQLEAKRLRDALTAMVAYAREDGCGLKIADEALSSQTSTEVLDAYVAEKVKDAIDSKVMPDDYIIQSEKLAAITRQRDLAVSALVQVSATRNIGSAHIISREALAAIKESDA